VAEDDDSGARRLTTSRRENQRRVSDVQQSTIDGAEQRRRYDDAGHSCVTAAQCTTAEAVVMVQVCMAVQSPNNTIAAENMAVDCHALVQIDSANLADF